MRVLDNLENYDIPSGFHLTAEQEEQLAADLKEIVLALIPLRSSKLKTRQYFNSHLRYTSNVKYAQSRPDAPQDRYEFGDSYTPLPGEYTWNSDLLQPALLDILRPDQWSFGYVVNYIEADNAFDPYAVAIYYGEYKLGFVPRGHNHDISKYLDMGLDDIYDVRITRISPEVHPEDQVEVIVNILNRS